MKAWCLVVGTLGALGVGGAACAGRSRVPDALNGYEILIPGRDSLSQALGRRLRESGFVVRRTVRGGGPPTAGLVHFSFREPELYPNRWLHARLFDTRSGVILAAVMVQLDSVPTEAKAQAHALVDLLLARAGGVTPTP